jgi:hypothetical protein
MLSRYSCSTMVLYGNLVVSCFARSLSESYGKLPMKYSSMFHVSNSKIRLQDAATHLLFEKKGIFVATTSCSIPWGHVQRKAFFHHCRVQFLAGFG